MGKEDQYDFSGADDELDTPNDSTGVQIATTTEDTTETDTEAQDTDVDSLDQQSSDTHGTRPEEIPPNGFLPPRRDPNDYSQITSAADLPLLRRRTDVKQFRSSVTVYLQKDTQRGFQKARRLLEDQFEDFNSSLDLYEVIFRNGLRDPDGLIEEAESMGFQKDTDQHESR